MDPLEIVQGLSFDPVFVWEQSSGVPVDLTQWEARMQVRATLDDEDTLVDVGTAGGGIALGGPEGTISIFVSAADTAQLPLLTAGVYALVLTHTQTGRGVELLRGTARITRSVVR